MTAPENPRPDSVRLALPAEAEAVADLQRRSWAASSEPVAEFLLGQVDRDQMVTAWRAAIARPPAARYRVLVALTGSGRITGFAATAPSDDADADDGRDGAIEEFVIDPPAQRSGHGSRLLHACVDTLRADGFAVARYWIPTGADVLRGFLEQAGWAPDGAFRELGTDEDSVRVKQIRLHTDISPS